MEQVVGQLVTLTGNDIWNSSIIKDGKRDAEYYSAVREALKTTSIISWEQNQRIFADLFGELLKHPEQYREDWMNLHSKFHNLQDRSFGLLIKLDPKHEYLICADPKQAVPGTIFVYKTKPSSHGKDGSPIFTFDTGANPEQFKNGIISAIQHLMGMFKTPMTLENFNSERVRVSVARIEYAKNASGDVYEDASIGN
jgi:hypothetical protein